MTAKPRRTSELKSERKQDGTGSTIMICLMCREMGTIYQVQRGREREKKGRTIYLLNS